MDKFDKEYYRQHRFYADKMYNIHCMLSQEYDNKMIDYKKNEFYLQYPKQINEDLHILEEELKKVNAYKAALEEGIVLFKKHYLESEI